MQKLTIIVPVYNSELYLKKCLNSLLNQTLKDMEIICVNDGSTDGSLDILKSFAQKDSRIKIIDKKNEGQSVARNIAIEQASGEYLGFVDSDDWVDLDYFEKLYNAAKKYDCDIACAGYKKCKKFVKPVKKKYKKYEVYKDINSKVKADNIPRHNYIWNKIYKRESWLNAGIKFPEGRVYEDIAILIKILYYTGDLVTVPNTYYYYREHCLSTVKNNSLKYLKDNEIAMKELKDFAKEKNIVLPKERIWNRKVYFKLFGFTVLKIYYYPRIAYFRLFGFIPFLSCSVKR